MSGPTGKTWPGMRAVIARRKAEMFAEQTWRPGCCRCGETAAAVLDPPAAQAWFAEHRAACAASAAA